MSAGARLSSQLYRFDKNGYPVPVDTPQSRAAPEKRQFSKSHVIFADAMVAFVWLSYIFLAIFDKAPPDYNIAVAIITVYGGFATGGYFALCGWRDNSLNKYVNSKNNAIEEETAG